MNNYDLIYLISENPDDTVKYVTDVINSGYKNKILIFTDNTKGLESLYGIKNLQVVIPIIDKTIPKFQWNEHIQCHLVNYKNVYYYKPKEIVVEKKDLIIGVDFHNLGDILIQTPALLILTKYYNLYFKTHKKYIDILNLCEPKLNIKHYSGDKIPDLNLYHNHGPHAIVNVLDQFKNKNVIPENEIVKIYPPLPLEIPQKNTDFKYDVAINKRTGAKEKNYSDIEWKRLEEAFDKVGITYIYCDDEKYSLMEVYENISKSKIYIGLDTGTTHLAACMRKPTIALWANCWGYEEFGYPELQTKFDFDKYSKQLKNNTIYDVYEKSLFLLNKQKLELKFQDTLPIGATSIKIFNKRNVWNGNLCRYDDNKYLFVYRHNGTNMQICWVDNNFNQIGKEYTNLPSGVDPKIIKINDEYKLTYSYSGYGINKEYMEMIDLKINKNNIEVDNNSKNRFLTIFDFPNYIKKREKSWAPFSWNDEIYYVYNKCPHQIIKYDTEIKTVKYIPECIFETQELKKYGNDIRGNGNACSFNDNLMITTFHIRHSNKYEIGYYFFEKNFPFTPVAYCKNILLNSEEYVKIKDIGGDKTFSGTCIFPGGLVDDNENVILSLGVNDIETHFIKYDKQWLWENSEKFNSYFDIKEFLSNKRIAVVSNSQTLLNSEYGKHIDENDFVIRFNKFSTDEKYVKNVGKKTDGYCFCIGQYNGKIYKYHWITYHYKDAEITPANIKNNNKTMIYQKIIPNNVIQTSGLAILEWLINNVKYKEINLYGFCGGETDNSLHYYEIFKAMGKHSLNCEKKIIEDIIKNNPKIRNYK